MKCNKNLNHIFWVQTAVIFLHEACSPIHSSIPLSGSASVRQLPQSILSMMYGGLFLISLNMTTKYSKKIAKSRMMKPFRNETVVTIEAQPEIDPTSSVLIIEYKP